MWKIPFELGLRHSFDSIFLELVGMVGTVENWSYGLNRSNGEGQKIRVT